MAYNKVLFVCSGNVCRSPMAEFIFNQLASGNPVLSGNGICARSAGTLDIGSSNPFDVVVQVMRERGLDITGHRSTHVSYTLVSWADIILVMEWAHVAYMMERFPVHGRKVSLLSEFAGEDGEVADPIGCGIDVYRQCAEEITGYVRAVVERIEHESGG